MTGALNFAPKAIADLRAAPYSRAACAWAADMLERAEVFQLPDCGQLLDRSKPKPEVPGLMFRPPYAVVACEYLAQRAPIDGTAYTAVPCSRRIALAWDWTGELPSPLGRLPQVAAVRPGVAVLSVFYIDAHQRWAINSAAMHFPYDGGYLSSDGTSPFEQAMILSGRIPRHATKVRGFETSIVPIAIEQLEHAVRATGSLAAAVDAIRADAMDECNAYIDLCYALACKNVSAQRVAAPKALNRDRARKGRPLLKDWHFLDLGGGGEGAGGSAGVGDRAGPRAHLRRGHIRRLAGDRVTWVNQTMVHGRGGGFVDKTYRVASMAPGGRP